MKSSIIAIIVLVLVILLTFYFSSLTAGVLDELKTDAERTLTLCGKDCEKILRASKEMRVGFETRIIYLSFFINDEDLLEITQYYDDIKSAAEADNYEGVLTAKNRLVSELEHLRRLSTFSVDAVF